MSGLKQNVETETTKNMVTMLSTPSCQRARTAIMPEFCTRENGCDSDFRPAKNLFGFCEEADFAERLVEQLFLSNDASSRLMQALNSNFVFQRGNNFPAKNSGHIIATKKLAPSYFRVSFSFVVNGPKITMLVVFVSAKFSALWAQNNTSMLTPSSLPTKSHINSFNSFAQKLQRPPENKLSLRTIGTYLRIVTFLEFDFAADSFFYSMGKGGGVGA